jgi:glycerol-3-phosphate acyltransferase PlsY
MVLIGIAPAEYLAFSIVAAVLIILQHKDNLKRLRAGAERRLGEKAERKADP